MGSLIMPKHTADIDYISSAMKVLYMNEDWMMLEDYKDDLFDELVRIEKESTRSSDETHYTKCSEIPRYFGFIDREQPGNKYSRIKLNNSGRAFYKALRDGKQNIINELIMLAIEKVCFGRNNEGCGSNSDCEPPVIFLQASIMLNGISNKELAFILDRMHNYGNSFETAIMEVQTSRTIGTPSINPGITSDIKFIGFFKRINICTNDNKLEINFLRKYHKRIIALSPSNTASNLFRFEDNEETLQAIYYGSPGTGKSWKVKNDILSGVDEKYIFRTTFHPDSDYASFVGSYKPVQRNGSTIFGPQGLTEEELINTFLNSNKASQKKARFLYESLVNMGDVKKLGLSHGDIDKALKSRGFTECTYNGEFSAMQTIHDWLLEDERFNKNEIIYEFVPQAFTEAYVKAKKCTEQVYLVIEEINRGNCAQIFGDLFQLLDRKNGVSEYPIKGEADLIKYLNEECGIEGDTLSLPANLNIIATMNTSDQSLFPMDSAFKRRWDWKYIPTMPPANEDKLLEFHQEGNKDKGLNVGDFVYSWKKFLEAANARIYAATRSEDKQLGYWFVKTGDDNKISISDFVSKVVFYLWNDVFKDLGPKDCNPFTIEVDGKKSIMPFNSFFELDSENNITENIGVLHTFLKNFNLTPDVAKEIQEAQDASNLEGPQA